LADHFAGTRQNVTVEAGGPATAYVEINAQSERDLVVMEAIVRLGDRVDRLDLRFVALRMLRRPPPVPYWPSTTDVACRPISEGFRLPRAHGSRIGVLSF
jgi:hypothetical protein